MHSFIKTLLIAPRWLTLVFFFPAFTDIIRKILPGQPNSITPLTSTLFVLLTYFITRKRIGKKIPSLLIPPLLIWWILLAIYSTIALLYSYKVGIASATLRFTPLLVPIIAFKQIDNIKQLEGIMAWVILLICLLLPISIISIIDGNSSLPQIFQPIDMVKDIRADQRGGFDICSGIFSTGAIMAFSILSFYFLLLSLALRKGSNQKLYLITALLSLIIMYSTVRRSTLYFAIIGLAIYIYLLKKKGFKFLILFITIFFTLFLFSSEIKDNQRNNSKRGFISRLTIVVEGLDDIDNRTSHVFLEILNYWINEKPLGTYLGYAGNEAYFDNVPRSSDLNAIETGAAQIVAETGILGLVIYVFSFIWLWKNILKHSRKCYYRDTIKMIMVGNTLILLLYLMQMVSIQFGMYIPQIIFWANPGIAWALIKSDQHRTHYSDNYLFN